MLSAASVPAAAFDAELLLRRILGRDRAWILTHGKDDLGEQERSLFDEAVRRRAAREPLQYITGIQEFRGIDFIVTPDVLIPRPETELVVEAALNIARKVPSPMIVDMCTGSGCIAVSIASELPGSRVFAADRDGRALTVARRNAQRHGVADRIRFLEGDLFAPFDELDLRGKADVITANPPYVKAGDLDTLQPEVKDFEPETALVAGLKGTEIAERIIRTAPAYLTKSGALTMEMGSGQVEALREMIRGTGAYGTIEILKDLAGIDRVVVVRKK